ncbi:MAG: hypothetical protein U0441_01420 [Polyangiaceae bacterium]
MGFAGAAFAVERSKLLNYLADIGGTALADGAACSTVNRSVHVHAGNGSFGWYQLLWPHVAIAQAGNPGFAYHSTPANTLFYQGDKMMAYAPEAPWVANGAPTRPVTAFMSGENETHTLTPSKSNKVASNATLCGTVAAIQRDQPVLLPVIGVGPTVLGDAPGAPAVATVPTGAAMVDLFNSAASQATLALKENQDLYETYYKAVLGLREASGRPTWSHQLEITKKAANLLSRNLAAQLTPSQADLDAYGIGTLPAGISNANAKQQLTNIGRTLITTARAFKLGLTNCVMLATTDIGTGDDQFTDPHKAFLNMTQLQAVVATFGKMFDSFYKDLASSPDPTCQSQTLDKSVIFTVHGDTPKTPRQTDAWPDGTEGNSNWLYVMGNGYLKNGWYGGIGADGSITGWDPTTGADVPGQASNVTTNAACAAVAYAVAKGDINKVSPIFYKGPALTGVINKV